MTWVYRRPFDYAVQRRKIKLRKARTSTSGVTIGPACITDINLAVPAVTAVNLATPAVSAVNLAVPSVTAVFVEACE